MMKSKTACTDAEPDRPAVATQVIVTSLSHEALMVAHLMESGWALHVAHVLADGHRLLKFTRNKLMTRVQRLDVSHDVIIELSAAKLIRKVNEFAINWQFTTVYSLL